MAPKIFRCCSRSIALLVLAIRGETIVTAVREGQDASVECNFRGNYVDFRRRIGDKEETIFVRTGKTNNDLDSSWEIINSTEDESKIRLRKTNANVADSGIYSCIDAQKKTTTFNLTVFAAPLSRVEFEADISAKYGETVSIGQCFAQASFPESVVYWKDNDGNRIPGEMRVIPTDAGKFTTRNELKIVVDQTTNDKKTYECIIEHRGVVQTEGSHSGVYSSSIDVLWAPRNISVQIAKSKLMVGDDLKLVCDSKANPPPSYRWDIASPNDTNVDKSHWQFTENIASTNSLKASDSGLQISCTAFNSVGDAVEVTVLEISESALFFAFTPTKIIYGVGVVLSIAIVILVIVLLYRYTQQRKTAVYKTGNVRNNNIPQQNV